MANADLEKNPNNRTPIGVRNEHHFVASAPDLYESDSSNLSVGAPGPDLLRYCAENFPAATKHLIVIFWTKRWAVCRRSKITTSI